MSEQTGWRMTYRCTREGCGVIFFTPVPEAIFEHALHHFFEDEQAVERFHEEVEDFVNEQTWSEEDA